MIAQITPVILCGGSGTRLWPLSRKSFPKQFVPIIGDKSLLDLTIARLAPIGSHIMAIAGEDHRFLVAGAMQGAGIRGDLLLEPVARNTAAAMAVAALRAASGPNDDPLLLFCPADHHIPDTTAFGKTVASGVAAANAGAIVTFGVVPGFPATGYGYILRGQPRTDGSWQVDKFIEKPDVEAATGLLLAGNALWNAGIFLCRAQVLLAALQAHAPDILQACRHAMATASEEIASNGCRFIRPDPDAFASCRAQSIDYAVMEPHDAIVTVPLTGQWSDVGSWHAVANLCEPGPDMNRIKGMGFALHATHTYINAPHRPVVALGTHNLLIVDTPDALLVAAENCAEQVKDVVAMLEKAHCAQAVSHSKVMRPWGWYDSIDAGERFQVKRIGVKPGAALSLQKHYHRAEHWVVVKGTAEVTCGEDKFLLVENQSTYIPAGEIHRLANPGKVELELIEIQSGSYLGEDDIQRLEDSYGRIAK
ncbi:MAG: mannose-phosphate guanylyltransferase/mannose-6-phosphate isomerase [Paucimonas sp.]|nr:mannose-phosphate guanylyltransferase/mannose-6-phosphate isomerase [Paucimonas sp.]